MVSHWTTICVISLCTFVNIVKDSLTQGRRNINKNLDTSLIGGHNFPTSIGIGLNFLSQIGEEQVPLIPIRSNGPGWTDCKSIAEQQRQNEVEQ